MKLLNIFLCFIKLLNLHTNNIIKEICLYFYCCERVTFLLILPKEFMLTSAIIAQLDEITSLKTCQMLVLFNKSKKKRMLQVDRNDGPCFLKSCLALCMVHDSGLPFRLQYFYFLTLASFFSLSFPSFWVGQGGHLLYIYIYLCYHTV